MCSHCGHDHRPGISICPMTGRSMAESGPCGTTIDRYEVTERIGKGGFGVVYRGRHVHTLREVALKILDAETLKDPTALARFEREAQVATAIRSPHVVEVYDWGVLPDGSAFLAMELLDGADLSTATADARPALPRALGIATELLAGLEAVHAAGAIHRDLKPSNVFLARAGGRERVKLLDFGCSRPADRADDRLLATRTGTTIGTPLYMPPEQLRGGNVDARSDVYAAAVVIFELLSGQRPFDGATYDDLVVRVCTEEPRTLAGVAGIPPHIADAVMRGLARDPAARWVSAAAFARALTDDVAMAETARELPSGRRGPRDSTRELPGVAVPAASRRRFVLPIVALLGAAGGIAAFHLATRTPSLEPVAITSPDAATRTLPPVAELDATPARELDAAPVAPIDAAITIVSDASVPRVVRRVPPVLDESCRKAPECAESGRCAPSKQGCVATTRADCEPTRGCKAYGMCTPIDGKCVVDSSEDCGRTHGCAHMGRCGADRASRTCIATFDGCRASQICRFQKICRLQGSMCVLELPANP